MFVWGRNNNHLFRHNHKKTYSLPQKIPINRTIAKCTAGYDYILLLNTQPGSLSCFYQSAFYQISNIKNVVDVSTTDNMIVIVTADGGAWIMEFNPEKIVEEELTPTRVHLQENVKNVYMNYGDIFLLCQSRNVYHLKRNEWYETKTYSDPQKIEGIDGKEIKSIAPALHFNYLLTTQGHLYYSNKNQPTKVMPFKISNKFISIAAADYFMGVSDNGRLLVWGQYCDQNYENPTEFGRLTQTFRSVTLSSENGFAVTSAGEAWIWGKNANGQLGISDYEPRIKPFPLITMEKQKIRNIYNGQGYTVCLIEAGQEKHKKAMKSYAIESMTFANNIPKPRESKKSISRDFSSIQLSENNNKSVSKGKEVSLKPIRTEVLRQIDPQQRKRISDVKTPQKISQRSKSPMGSQKSGNSKSPASKGFKSPYLEHLREKSHSNNKLKKDPGNKSKTALSPAKMHDYSLQIKSLQEENIKLKKMLALKENIIDDITSKIRMLQDAIDEHERNLTARDNLMEEYQRRQKEYQIHIDELEKSIETLIKGKNERPNSENYFNDMYKSLKNEFSKEKEYYMNRMKSYEEQLQAERAQYKEKIKMLEEQVYTYRSNSHRDKYERHESKYLDGYDLSNSKVGNKIKQYLDNSVAKEENRHKMQLMISRIQDSKVRIGKSASKLIEMLQN